MSSDNESTISGTRCQTDKILEIVQVFPHGACHVREIFFDLIKTLNTPNGKLRSYRSLISIGNWGEESYPELLNTNIWSLRYQTIPMPSGYYEGALGQTFVWVDYWTWHPTSFWTSWLESSDEPIKENRQPFLEVSCLTWFYNEMDDYETSLVIELHKPMGRQKGIAQKGVSKKGVAEKGLSERNEDKSNEERRSESIVIVKEAVSALKIQHDWNSLKVRQKIQLIKEQTLKNQGVSISSQTLYRSWVRSLW